MNRDESYKDSLLKDSFDLVSDIVTLKEQLSSLDTGDETDKVPNHLLEVVLSRMLNILPPDHEYFIEVSELLGENKMCITEVSVADIVMLMIDQGAIPSGPSLARLISEKIIGTTLEPTIPDDIRARILSLLDTENISSSSELRDIINSSEEVANVFLSIIDTSYVNAQPEIDLLIDCLRDIGLSEVIDGETRKKELSGVEAIRWRSVIAPQRSSLRGHMEKVHAKSSLLFGDDRITQSELLIKQLDSLRVTDKVYQDRIALRRSIDLLAKDIYELIFLESAEKTIVMSKPEISTQLDILLESLLSSNFDEDIVRDTLEMCRNGEMPRNIYLDSILQDFADRYMEICEKIAEHTENNGISHNEARQGIVDSSMSLFETS